MRKILFYLLLIPFTLFSQDSKWRDYFSYFNVKTIQQVDSKIFCGTDGGMFSYDFNSGEVKKISKVNGLNGVNVSAFNYNNETQTFLIGYSDGKFDLFTPDGIQLNIDIPIDSDFQGNKSINHISSDGNLAVLSMDFGVLYFDVKNKEFRETIYFRQSGAFIEANESIIYKNSIFTATKNGIYSKVINASLPDFSTWNLVNSAQFQHIEIFNDEIIASSNNSVYNTTNSGLNWNVFTSITDIKDITSNGDFVSIISKNAISTFNKSLNSIKTETFTEDLNTGIYSNNSTYGGTSLKGLLNTDNQYVPDGPFNNSSYYINLIDDKIWISSGGLKYFFDPNNTKYGYYYFDGTKWNHQSSQSLNGATNIIDVIPNPNNVNEVFVTCYDYGSQGILKVNDGNLTKVYNHTNSTISIPNHMISGVFDAAGNLFVSERSNDLTGGNYGHSIHIINPNGEFKEIDLNSIKISDGVTGNTKHILDGKGFLYLAQARGYGVGILDYNNTPFNTSDDKLYSINTEDTKGKLPTNNVSCVELDNTGTLWIGTTNGIRFLKNPKTEIVKESFETERIIIEENGLGEELFRDIQINDIATDKANRKWIATENAGVFYISANGQKTFNVFTVNNSPLPSNAVQDIAIDHKNGLVYFTTALGTVSYKSDVANAPDDFDSVFIYPNPVRPGFSGNVVLRNIPSGGIVKITDVVGNLVYEQKAQGGIVEWNQRNLQGNLVASGIYLALMTNSDGSKTGTSKIAIVR